jgi:hypothetical protein
MAERRGRELAERREPLAPRRRDRQRREPLDERQRERAQVAQVADRAREPAARVSSSSAAAAACFCFRSCASPSSRRRQRSTPPITAASTMSSSQRRGACSVPATAGTPPGSGTDTFSLAPSSTGGGSAGTRSFSGGTNASAGGTAPASGPAEREVLREAARREPVGGAAEQRQQRAPDGCGRAVPRAKKYGTSARANASSRCGV